MAEGAEARLPPRDSHWPGVVARLSRPLGDVSGENGGAVDTKVRPWARTPRRAVVKRTMVGCFWLFSVLLLHLLKGGLVGR